VIKENRQIVGLQQPDGSFLLGYPDNKALNSIDFYLILMSAKH